MLNWIANSFNAGAVANGGLLTQTDDVGVQGDGLHSYVRSNYIPSTAGGKMTQNNVSYGIKVSGTLLLGTANGHGSGDANTHLKWVRNGGGTPSAYNFVNCAT